MSIINSVIHQFGLLDENYQQDTAFYSEYPTIYEQEDLSTIIYNEGENEIQIAKGAGLGMSEQTSFIERDALAAVSKKTSTEGKITTANSIRPHGTYCLFDSNELSALLRDYKDLVLPTGTYWIASRSIHTLTNQASFTVFYANSGDFRGEILFGNLFDEWGKQFHYDACYSLFPIVSIPANLFAGNSTDGWSVK